MNIRKLSRHRHNHIRTTLTSLAMVRSLTEFIKAHTDERVDRIYSADDRECRVRAESWNVVTIGWLRSNGSFSSSK